MILLPSGVINDDDND